WSQKTYLSKLNGKIENRHKEKPLHKRGSRYGMPSQIGTNGTSGISPEAASWKRYDLRNRYVLTGKLVMQTAFHIGGGRGTLSNSDSPVVLTPEGLPFIPGSSFKGSLRSTIEKLVPNLPETARLRTCGLLDMGKDAFKELTSQER